MERAIASRGGKTQPRPETAARREYRCGDCGYGIVIGSRRRPACPMCGSSHWLVVEHRLELVDGGR
jgi:rubrerythrin